VPAAAPPEAPLTLREDESQTQSDEPELPHPTEATQADDSSASVDLQEGDEKLNENPGVAFGEIAGTSVANGDAYACAECGVKMKGIFYVCLTCAGSSSIRLTRHKA
jgi:lipopolysaccharide biosynthesis regulator YciM